MVDLGKGTKAANADNNEIIAKHMRKDIRQIEKRIDYAEKYIPYLEANFEGMKKQKKIQEKVWKIQAEKPAKLEPEYEFEKDDNYKKLMEERAELSREKTRLDTDWNLYNKQREIKEYKESLDEDKKMLDHKKQELEKLKGE